jgi:hypothetical protein
VLRIKALGIAEKSQGYASPVASGLTFLTKHFNTIDVQANCWGLAKHMQDANVQSDRQFEFQLNQKTDRWVAV